MAACKPTSTRMDSNLKFSNENDRVSLDKSWKLDYLPHTRDIPLLLIWLANLQVKY